MQIHGGDIYQNEVTLDYSANLNPFGMPERVKDAAVCGVMDSIHYPDMNCSKLKDAIAKKEEVKTEEIFCGNGAAEVIFQLVRAYQPKKAVLPVPTFGEYEQALKAVNCEIVKFYLKESEGFLVTEDLLPMLNEEVDLLFLCNPNNPTGETIPSDTLLQIVRHCKEHEILLVMDVCFQDFLQDEDRNSLKSQREDNQYLFLLKAFTKMYGMAGLRLGYGITSNQALIQRMRQLTQAWNVSLPAQYAGVAACHEEEFAKRTREYVALRKEELMQELQRFGFVIYGSKANYIFFRGPQGLYEAMLKHKILIRSCESYDGLDETYYRIAVKRKEENDEFITTLRDVMEEWYGKENHDTRDDVQCR